MYRRRRNSLLAALFSWIALVISIGLFPNAPLLGPFWWLVALPIFIWMVVANLRIVFWSCPACGRAYFTKGAWFGNIFAQNCLHCGLPKWHVTNGSSRGA